MRMQTEKEANLPGRGGRVATVVVVGGADEKNG